MEVKEQSFVNAVFGAIRNPQCTRDALKALMCTAKTKDARLMVAQRGPNLDDSSARNEDEPFFDLCEEKHSELHSEQMKSHKVKVELLRLLYLLPYFMQQFLSPSQLDQQFHSRRGVMISLLKRSLPSVGIDKKGTILKRLEAIEAFAKRPDLEDNLQGQEYQALKSEFEGLLQETVGLVYREGFRGSLMECF